MQKLQCNRGVQACAALRKSRLPEPEFDCKNRSPAKSHHINVKRLSRLAHRVLHIHPMTSSTYGQAYEAGFARTIRFLVSRGVGKDDAQEVAQAAWARGWECVSQLREDSLVFTWVNTIALNIYRRALHSERQCQPLPQLFSRLTIDLAAIDVACVLKSCRPRERRLLEQQMQGTTAKEIAEDNGVTETTIRIRLMRARRALRARVEGSEAHRRHPRSTGRV
jgi:DNA-directed RNA polymerase specialized sigma24 family protein